MAAVALLGASCGGGDGGGDEGGEYGSDLLSATTVTVAPRQRPSETTSPPATSRRPTGTVRGVTTPPTRAPQPGKDPLPEASHATGGAFAGYILRPAPVTKIVYEILQEPGLNVLQSTLDVVVGEIRRYADKPVTVERTPIPDQGKSEWTTGELGRLGDRYARFNSAGDTAALRLIVVNGNVPGASGVSFRGDTIAIFPDTYKSGGIVTPAAQVEKIVTLHETGHMLGLVDTYLETGRGDYVEDPAGQGHHSPNKRSVMYWRVDELTVASVLDGGPPGDFDANDRADLEAIHAGAPMGAKSRTQRSADFETVDLLAHAGMISCTIMPLLS